MKKLIVFTFALIMSVSLLASCNEQKNEEETAQSAVTTVADTAVTSTKAAVTTEPAESLNCVSMFSSSMEPTIPLGALVYYDEIDPADLKTGDIIVCEIGKETGDATTVVHRIIEVITQSGEDSIYFRMQGDANSEPDLVNIPASDVLGIAVSWDTFDPAYLNGTTD